jgi:subtilisin family serine protease
VIHNNAPGVFNGTLGSPIDGTTPVVGISLEDGEYMKAQAAPASLTWTDQKVSSPNPTGGYIASSSSYGLAADLSLKPDIGAPGGSIYSTYPLELGGYATLGGTSMASPHVAAASISENTCPKGTGHPAEQC